MKNHLPKCTGPVVKVEILGERGPQKTRTALTMYVCWLHRQSLTLLDPTEGMYNVKG